jgi:hypothetical protein
MKLYWRMYQDKESVKYSSVILTKEEMEKEVDLFFKEGLDDYYENPPIFEPVMMEEEDFKKLPEFEGF